MAFGFSPKHIYQVPLEFLTPQQFLVLALETVKKLEWNINHVGGNGFVAHTKFSMSSYGEEVRLTIENNVATLKSECSGSQLVDWGKNKKNIENFLAGFNDLKNAVVPEQLDRMAEEMMATLTFADKDTLSQSVPEGRKGTGFLSIFKPVKGYFISPLLIDVNIIIFILMVASGVNIMLPDNDSLLLWGANFKPLTLGGEWWRLLTNCFLHIGVLHLVMNMYALFYIGLLLEPYLGKARFLIAYLLTGLTASMASLWWHDLTISAGASGAIFGMYGVFLAMLTTSLIEASTRKSLLASISIFVGYNLLFGLQGGIDNAAHIGGLIGGLIIGYAYYPSLKRPAQSNFQYVTMAGLSVLILAASFLVYGNLPNDIGKYNMRMEEFASLEKKALQIYTDMPNTPPEDVMTNIKDNGIRYWNESIKLLNEVETLDLPEEIHERNKKLISYCEVRIKSYELIYKALDEDTDVYNSEIASYNDEISSIINSLKEK